MKRYEIAPIPDPSFLRRFDGRISAQTSGPDYSVSEAVFPATRLPPESTSVLARAVSLRVLDIAGEHFPTTTITPEELAHICAGNQLCTLFLHGAYLKDVRLCDVISGLPGLVELGLQGTHISETLLSKLLPPLRGLRVVRLGIAPPSRSGHRFTPDPLGPATLAVIDQLPLLDSVSLRGLRATDDDFAQCKSFSHASQIDLGETRAGDLTAQCLLGNPRLQQLTIDQSDLSDSGLKLLAKVPTLETLNIAWTSVSDEGVVGLGSASGLRELNIAGLRLANSTVTQLGSLSSLEKLDLRNMEGDGSSVETLLKKLQNLRELFLGPILPPKGFETIASLPLLEHVELSLLTSDVESWNALSKVTAKIDLVASAPPMAAALPPRIQSYTLNNGFIDLRALERIAAQPSLSKLSLKTAGDVLNGLGSDAVVGLRELFCEDAALSDISLARLADCPRLQALYISKNPIGDSGVAALRGSPWLHTIELRYTKITDDAIGAIVSLPRLHCLDLPGTAVTDKGVARLAAVPNLQSLALDAGQVTPRSMEALASAPILVEVYLYGDEVTAEKIRLLASLPELAELNLFYVNLPVEAAEAIAACPYLRIVRMIGEIPDELIVRLKKLRPSIVIEFSSTSSASTTGRSAA